MKIVWFVLVMMVGLSPSVSALSREAPKKGNFVYSLKKFQGKKNLLLVFAVGKLDARFVKQLEAMKGRDSDFHKQNVGVFYIFEGEKGRADSAHLRISDAEDLRTTFQVEPGSFRLIYIDKQGKIKRKSDGPLDRQKLMDFISVK